MLQHTGHACLHLAGVRSRLLLMSIDSEHTVMHSSYTNRRLRCQKVATDDQYTVSYSTVKNLSRHLHSVSSQLCLRNLQLSYSKLHAPATPPKHFSSPIGKLCLFWKIEAKILLIDHTGHTVVLNYSLSRHTEYVRQI